MASIGIANLVLALAASVAVLSALGGIACVAWVTRGRESACAHSAGDHFQAAEGARRGA